MQNYYVRYFQDTEKRLLLTGFSIQPQYLHNMPYILTFVVFLFEHGFTNKLNDSIHLFLAEALQDIKARHILYLFHFVHTLHVWYLLLMLEMSLN